MQECTYVHSLTRGRKAENVAKSTVAQREQEEVNCMNDLEEARRLNTNLRKDKEELSNKLFLVQSKIVSGSLEQSVGQPNPHR